MRNLKARVKAKTKCWECISHKPNNKGYIIVRINNKKRSLHRLSYEYYKEKIPKGLCVRHTCDNPKCFNPTHLILGTHLDNMRDMAERNRSARGERNTQAVLKEKQVKEIYLNKLDNNKVLAKKYGVTHSNISCIRLGKTWKHITKNL